MLVVVVRLGAVLVIQDELIDRIINSALYHKLLKENFQ